MKIIWTALLHASAYAAQKLYGEPVTQVDVWLESGRKLLLMDRDESDRLAIVAKEISGKWTDEERDELRKAIAHIRKHESEAGNA